ncbi:MAG: hypothetical protein QME87_08055 [Bacillota bacterium]|nr:hypothetical protein [Bacillota bacterium]
MPVSRDELIRYRRLLELARAQRDAVAAGQLSELPHILAERRVLLAGVGSPTDPPGDGDEPGSPARQCDPRYADGATGSPPQECGPPCDEDGPGSPAQECDPPDAGGGEPEAEARELLRSILEVDRECQCLVSERLRAIEGDLAVTRTALEGSRAYRQCLEAGRAARVLDELK